MAMPGCSNLPSAIASSSSPTLRRPNQPSYSINFFKHFSSSRTLTSPSLPVPRLRIYHRKVVLPKRSNLLLTISGLLDDNSETYPEAEKSDSNAGATLDIKLLRRSLVVQFK